MHTYHVKSPIDLWLLLLLLEWTENVFLLCWNYLAIFTSQNISLQIFWDHFLYQKKMRCQESKCTPYMMGLHSQLPFLGNFAFKLFIVLWSCLWRGNDRKLSKKGKLFLIFHFSFCVNEKKIRPKWKSWKQNKCRRQSIFRESWMCELEQKEVDAHTRLEEKLWSKAIDSRTKIQEC
jgi:hypothetical protein